MNKNELIAALAKEAGCTQVTAEQVFNALVKIVTASLKQGDKIAVPGFITISKQTRAARTGRNPRTGASLNIPAKNVASFKAGKTLEDAIN